VPGPSTKDHATSTALLDVAYDELGLRSGVLLEASSAPRDEKGAAAWPELGDWLLSASRMKAERVFFVNGEPVVVFAECDEADVAELYRSAWSMARPRLLFVAVGAELRVYGLDRPPRRESRPPASPLATVEQAADIGSVLDRYRRDRLETGTTFNDVKAGKRADHQLLADVRVATAELCEAGLSLADAHSLLERAILVRYLEDRDALTPDYFQSVADEKARWRATLAAPSELPEMGPSSMFLRCLGNRELTFEVLDRLASDFNGDLFRVDPSSDKRITAEHLQLLARMLGGQMAAGQQQRLFLWAYDFSVVPTGLISTMYELFHHAQGLENSNDTHYTSAELVELVLADVLDERTLARGAVVCDPACGSGAFLVEAYRRIVRFEMGIRRQRLDAECLRDLLLNRIRGIDIDASAVRLAAFGLYLALLNHLEPKDIRSTLPLPRLIRRGCSGEGSLVIGDVFPDPDDPGADVFDEAVDVVVGNPPWSEPSAGGRSRAERWAKASKLPVANRSPSALFCWRALDLLDERGTAALLINSGILRNRRDEAFRRRFMQAAEIEHIIDFAAARTQFFKNAKAPFALLRFTRAVAESEMGASRPRVVLEKAVPAPQRALRGSLAYLRLERRVAHQQALRDRSYLWKAYLAGGPRDQTLLARLELEEPLGEVIKQPMQFGLQNGPNKPSETVRSLPVLSRFLSWGAIDLASAKAVPASVKYEPDPALIRGRRILLRTGVSEAFGGHARLLTEPYAFRHDVLGIPVDGLSDSEAKVLLGILISSLGRYWMYMQSPTWGYWYEVVSKEAVQTLPVRLGSAEDSAVAAIVRAVDALPDATSPPSRPTLWSVDDGQHDVRELLATIDAATYDLYELTGAERDVVDDFWLAQRREGRTAMPGFPIRAGLVEDLVDRDDPMSRYLRTFVGGWNSHLEGDGHLDWAVGSDAGSAILAAVFRTRAPDDDGRPEPLPVVPWQDALGRLSEHLDPVRASRVVAQGVVRAVTDTAIVIVKRDERALWTPSAAREDVDATLLQAMAMVPA
jgi:hypothetical protein